MDNSLTAWAPWASTSTIPTYLTWKKISCNIISIMYLTELHSSEIIFLLCKVMAIGDGENDIEMLQLASFGVALANGSDKTKAAANVIGATNDEDGVAQAIYEYAF